MPRLEYVATPVDWKGKYDHRVLTGSVHTCNSCWPPSKQWFEEFLSPDYWGWEYLTFISPPHGFEQGYHCLVCDKVLTAQDIETQVIEPTYLEVM